VSLAAKVGWKFHLLFNDSLLKFLSVCMCKWWLQEEIFIKFGTNNNKLRNATYTPTLTLSSAHFLTWQYKSALDPKFNSNPSKI
jgi:hypothetical protein